MKSGPGLRLLLSFPSAGFEGASAPPLSPGSSLLKHRECKATFCKLGPVAFLLVNCTYNAILESALGGKKTLRKYTEMLTKVLCFFFSVVGRI